MTSEKTTAGIAFLCDLDGKVLRVVRDELGISETFALGRHLPLIVDRGSFNKALSFIIEVKSKGAAFDWQLVVPVSGEMDVLNFAGVIFHEGMLIVGAKTREDLEQLFDELVKIGNEQANLLRAAVKESVDLARNHADRDSALYDELGRLNNELANLQRELAKKNAELERLNEQKNQFLGIAAHDLRNPLNAILMYSEFLLDEASEALDEEQLEFVSIIRSSSEFMLRLVNNLLDVAKIESGKLQLDLASTDLKSLVERNISVNRALASRKQIELSLTCVGDIPTLVVDPSKIEQVLNNLVTNAIKFSEPGSAVKVLLEEKETQVILSVRDHGPGIPPEELDKLFQPFQKTSVRATGGEQSTGLGLAIVRKIVQGHQGEIWVESERGKGSVFYVSLPMEPRKTDRG